MITSLERITFQLLKSLASSWPTLSPSVIWIVMLSLDMVIKNQFAVWAKPNCHYWSLSWRGEVTSKLLISSLSFKSQIGTEQHHLTSTYLNLSYCRISLCSASEMKPCESPSLWRFAVRLQVADPVSDFLLVSRAGKTSSWKKKKSRCIITQNLNVSVAGLVAGLLSSGCLAMPSWWRRCSWSLEPKLSHCIFTLFVLWSDKGSELQGKKKGGVRSTKSVLPDIFFVASRNGCLLSWTQHEFHSFVSN